MEEKLTVTGTKQLDPAAERKNKCEVIERIQATVENPEKDLDMAIDTTLASSNLPLEQVEQEIVNNIIEAPTKEDLQKQFELFNNNQVKKNALRIIRLNDLLTKVEDQAIERFEKRPDLVSNKELIEYMNVVSQQIERAQKFNSDTLSVENKGINIKNQNNEININVAPVLDRDGKEHVMDAISALLKQVQKNRNDTIDAEYVEPSDSESTISEEDNVYNNETGVLNVDESEEN